MTMHDHFLSSSQIKYWASWTCKDKVIINFKELNPNVSNSHTWMLLANWPFRHNTKTPLKAKKRSSNLVSCLAKSFCPISWCEICRKIFLHTPSSGSSVGEILTIKTQEWFLEYEVACSKLCWSTWEGLLIKKHYSSSVPTPIPRKSV